MNNSITIEYNASVAYGYIIVRILILVFTLFGNVFVVTTIYKIRNLHTTLNYLIVNLSICDVLIILSSLPFEIAMRMNPNKGFLFGPIACRLISPISTLASNGAVYTLMWITIERYIAIAHPIKYVITKRHILKIILSTYVYGFLTILPYAFHMGLTITQYGVECHEQWSLNAQKTYTIVLFLLQYGIPLPVMITLYALAWIKLKKHNDQAIQMSEEQNRSMVNEKSFQTIQNQPMNRVSGNYRKELWCSNKILSKLCCHKHKKCPPFGLVENMYPYIAQERRKQTLHTFFMFFVIVVVFAICSLPNQLNWIWITFYSNYGNISEVTVNVFLVLHYSNCFINPWIYGGLNRGFRRAYNHILKCGHIRRHHTPPKRRDVLHEESIVCENKRMPIDLFKDGIISRLPLNYKYCGSFSTISVNSQADNNEDRKTNNERFFSLNPLKILKQNRMANLSKALTLDRQVKLTSSRYLGQNFADSYLCDDKTLSLLPTPSEFKMINLFSKLNIKNCSRVNKGGVFQSKDISDDIQTFVVKETSATETMTRFPIYSRINSNTSGLKNLKSKTGISDKSDKFSTPIYSKSNSRMSTIIFDGTDVNEKKTTLPNSTKDYTLNKQFFNNETQPILKYDFTEFKEAKESYI